MTTAPADEPLPPHVFDSPALRDTLEHLAALAREAGQHAAAISPIILHAGTVARQVTAQIDPEALAHAVRPAVALAASMQAIDLTHIATSVALLAEAAPRVDVMLLDDLLRSFDPWQHLFAPARDAVADVVDDARTAVENGESRDVPDGVVAELEEQADQFATAAPGLLPPAVLKYLFAVWAAGMVMSTLMYLSITSDTANAILDEAYQHGEIALIVYLAACTAWDKRQTNRRSDTED